LGKESKRTRIISVGGGKGGVGKSVLSSNLAVAIADMGYRTVLADVDLGTANQHLLLGVRNPKPGIQLLLSRDIDDVRDGLSETGIENLSLLAATGSTLGAANIRYREKLKLLRKLRRLDADVVVVDVGAGVGYNALDFFELGAQRLVVTTPQVTAIHDAYSFLKGAVLRTISHQASGLWQRSLLGDANKSGEGERVIDILAQLEARDPAFHERIFNVLRNFGAYIVGNQVTAGKQTGIFHAVSKMIQDYLGLSVPILGWLKASDDIRLSVNRASPLVVSGEGDNARAVREMAETLLVEEVVMEEELLIEIDDEAPLEEDCLNTSALSPSDLIVPAVAPDNDTAEELRPTGNPSYLGGPQARVYQPPQRRKPPRKKKRKGGRKRLITSLPGMPPQEVQSSEIQELTKQPQVPGQGARETVPDQAKRSEQAESAQRPAPQAAQVLSAGSKI